MKYSQGKNYTSLCLFPRLKASLERDISHKKILIRSHVLTKQNVILVQNEIVIAKCGKEDFIFMFMLKEVGLWAQGGGGGNHTQGKYLGYKF